jgi:hypothetical protein
MPAWLLPALFTGGSMLANAVGNGQRSSANADVLRANDARRKRLDAEAAATNTRARTRYDDFGGQMQERSGTLADMYSETAAAAPTRPISAAPPTSSNVTASAEGAEGLAVAGEADDMRQRRARLRAPGDVLSGISFGQARDAGTLSQLFGFSRGNQNVMPMELDAAIYAGAPWMMAGDLLNLGAGITTQRALIDPKSLAALYGGGR